MKKNISTTCHYFQYMIAIILMIQGFGFLIYSICLISIDAVVFCLLFLSLAIYAIKKIGKPNKIYFDEKYIYNENEETPIKIESITGIKKNKIIIRSDSQVGEIRLPNLYSLDKNWSELKALIDKNCTQTKK